MNRKRLTTKRITLKSRTRVLELLNNLINQFVLRSGRGASTGSSAETLELCSDDSDILFSHLSLIGERVSLKYQRPQRFQHLCGLLEKLKTLIATCTCGKLKLAAGTGCYNIGNTPQSFVAYYNL